MTLPPTITYPGSKAVTSGFDDAGRMTTVGDWLSNTTAYTPDADSNITKATPSRAASGSPTPLSGPPTTRQRWILRQDDRYAKNPADDLRETEVVMPVDLVLVRHGRSEGNEAREQSKQGDNSCYTEEFRARLNREWRLTDLGIAQAEAAGQWVREHVSPTFSRYYTSEHLRARETAAHLRLPKARWVQDILLRERSWGRADFVMPESERFERFSAELSARKEDPCYWRPPEGESLAEVCLRVERVLNTLRRDCPGGSCILSTHEDVMWAARFLIEGMTQEQWRGLLLSDDPRDKIHNGQVLHYSRKDPASGQCSNRLEWVRSACPWDPARSTDHWRRIKSPSFSNEELLASVAAVKRLIAGRSDDFSVRAES